VKRTFVVEALNTGQQKFIKNLFYDRKINPTVEQFESACKALGKIKSELTTSTRTIEHSDKSESTKTFYRSKLDSLKPLAILLYQVSHDLYSDAHPDVLNSARSELYRVYPDVRHLAHRDQQEPIFLSPCTKEGGSPLTTKSLYLLIREGHFEEVNLNPQLSDEAKYLFCFELIHKGEFEVIDTLLKTGPEGAPFFERYHVTQEKNQESMLLKCLMAEDDHAVRYLVESIQVSLKSNQEFVPGTSVSTPKPEYGDTELHYVLRYGSDDMVSLFLDHYGDHLGDRNLNDEPGFLILMLNNGPEHSMFHDKRVQDFLTNVSLKDRSRLLGEFLLGTDFKAMPLLVEHKALIENESPDGASIYHFFIQDLNVFNSLLNEPGLTPPFTKTTNPIEYDYKYVIPDLNVAIDVKATLVSGSTPFHAAALLNIYLPFEKLYELYPEQVLTLNDNNESFLDLAVSHLHVRFIYSCLQNTNLPISEEMWKSSYAKLLSLKDEDYKGVPPLLTTSDIVLKSTKKNIDKLLEGIGGLLVYLEQEKAKDLASKLKALSTLDALSRGVVPLASVNDIVIDVPPSLGDKSVLSREILDVTHSANPFVPEKNDLDSMDSVQLVEQHEPEKKTPSPSKKGARNGRFVRSSGLAKNPKLLGSTSSIPVSIRPNDQLVTDSVLSLLPGVNKGTDSGYEDTCKNTVIDIKDLSIPTDFDEAPHGGDTLVLESREDDTKPSIPDGREVSHNMEGDQESVSSQDFDGWTMALSRRDRRAQKIIEESAQRPVSDEKSKSISSESTRIVEHSKKKTKKPISSSKKHQNQAGSKKHEDGAERKETSAEGIQNVSVHQAQEQAQADLPSLKDQSTATDPLDFSDVSTNTDPIHVAEAGTQSETVHSVSVSDLTSPDYTTMMAASRPRNLGFTGTFLSIVNNALGTQFEATTDIWATPPVMTEFGYVYNSHLLVRNYLHPVVFPPSDQAPLTYLNFSQLYVFDELGDLGFFRGLAVDQVPKFLFMGAFLNGNPVQNMMFNGQQHTAVMSVQLDS